MNRDKNFILELLNILGPIPVKEALLGKLGYKVSRIGINPADYTKVLNLLDKFSVKYVVGNFRYTYKLDVGKGGWSNKFSDEISINEKLKITFLPAVHWSKRSLTDTNKTLWGNFLIEYDGKKILFACDTGIGNIYKDLGNKYGPIDISFINIGL